MQNFSLKSFLLGLGSGAVIIVIVFAGMRMMRPGVRMNGQFQAGGNRQMNTARMAERFGMTEDELNAELKAGKTMQDIAKEHGVDFAFGGRGPATGSGRVMTGSGNAVSSSSSK